MANIADRLTIQIDLSGFSFKITDQTGGILFSGEKSFPSVSSYGLDFEAILKKELSSFSHLGKKNNGTDIYVATPKFTLIPTHLYIKGEEKRILSQIHKIGELDEVMSVEIPQYQATLIYAIPNSVTSRIFKIQKKARYYPSVYGMIQRMLNNSDNNKICVCFSKEDVHITAAEGNRLLLANSYPAKDFVTALYYLFLVIKEVMFNPEFTTLQVMGTLTKGQTKDLSKYFKGICTF